MLLEKINSSRTEIENFAQGAILWNRAHQSLARAEREIPGLTEILNGFQGDSLTRAQVIDCFSKGEMYKGYVAMLMWGHAFSAYPYNNFKRTVNPDKQHETVSKLDNVAKLMAEGQIREAFNSLCRGGKNNIPCVGLSYFTKLMHFMGWNLDITPKPLIWDSKLQYVHCALLTEMDKSKATDFYKLNKQGNLAFAAKDLSEIYMDYLMRMHSFNLPADKLEAFLFKDENYKMAKGIVYGFFGKA